MGLQAILLDLVRSRGCGTTRWTSDGPRPSWAHPGKCLFLEIEGGTRPIAVAAELDEVGAVRLLIEHGADMEAEAVWGQTPFEWAANMNAEKSAATLLKAGSRGPDLWTGAALGLVAVVERAFLGHEETISGAPARLKNDSGRTAPPAATTAVTRPAVPAPMTTMW